MNHKKQSFILCIFAISIMKSKAEIEKQTKFLRDLITDTERLDIKVPENNAKLQILEWVLED